MSETSLKFDLAQSGDDEALKRLLRESPMPGSIRVRFEREPSFLDAARVEGRTVNVVVARNGTGIVAMGVRACKPAFVNGERQVIGYLSGLRVLPAYRNARTLAAGYRFLRKLHDTDESKLYLSTIVDGNDAAARVLTSGRFGLPAYNPVGRFHVVCLRAPRLSRPSRPGPVDVRFAGEGDLPLLLEFLNHVGRRKQFFPVYEATDFHPANGLLRGLRVKDVLLAFRAGSLAGCVGLWDQDAFRQTVVDGYERALSLARPVLNPLAPIVGWPMLPRPGSRLQCVKLVLTCVTGDAPAIFQTLLSHATRACARRRRILLAGLHESDPLLPVLRSRCSTEYTSHVYLVCWPDGRDVLKSLDGRPTYLELGGL